MKYSSQFLWLFCSLLSGSTDAAWIVHSPNENAWATGLGRFNPLRRIFTISVDFFDGTNELSESGHLDTNCHFLVADGTGHWEELVFDNPNLCVGGATAFQRGEGTAFFVGISGNQTMLRGIGGLDGELLTAWTPRSLPPGTIPVAIDSDDAEKFLYIALHDLAGDSVGSGFGSSPTDNLLNMMEYWRKFTNPKFLDEIQQRHVPHIIKVEPITGEVESVEGFETEFNTANALISSMQYHDGYLIVVGSTNGSGEFYGRTTDDTWDAYVGFLELAAHSDNPDTSPQEPIRISSVGMGGGGGVGAHDFGEEFCITGDTLFVVGTTEGRLEGAAVNGGPFVVKIDLRTRTVTATKQFDGQNRLGQKIVCTLNHVYVAGQINYPGEDKPQDIYVAAYEHDLETLYWEIKIDSSPYFGGTRRDQLVAIEMNPAMDVNILWNSQVLDQGISQTVMMDIQGDSGANEIQNGATAAQAGIPEGGIDVEPVVDTIGNEGDSTGSNGDIEEGGDDGSQGTNTEGGSLGSDTDGNQGSNTGSDSGTPGGDNGVGQDGSTGDNQGIDDGGMQGTTNGGSQGSSSGGAGQFDNVDVGIDRLSKAEADRERKRKITTGLGIALPIACLAFVIVVHKFVDNREKFLDAPPEMSPADAAVV